jgi:hypothetical protein
MLASAKVTSSSDLEKAYELSPRKQSIITKLVESYIAKQYYKKAHDLEIGRAHV